jgi:hypothetical protein
MKRETRDRKHPLKVVVSEAERQEIKYRAQAARLSVSAFLRNLGLGSPVKSAFDREAIRVLIKLHTQQGDLARAHPVSF